MRCQVCVVAFGLGQGSFLWDRVISEFQGFGCVGGSLFVGLVYGPLTPFFGKRPKT